MVRHEVADASRAPGFAGDRLQGFVLAINEVITNVVLHAGGHGRIVLWLTGGSAWCTVTDSGPGIPERYLSPPDVPEAFEVGGRGIWLAYQLCDEVTMATGPIGTTIGLRIALPRWRSIGLVNGASPVQSTRETSVEPLAALKRWSAAATTLGACSDFLPHVTACLFDLDGVLTQTALVHNAAWKQTFDDVPPGAGPAPRASRSCRSTPGADYHRLCRRPAARRRRPDVPRLPWHHPARRHARTTVRTRRPSTASATARTSWCCKDLGGRASRSTRARSST